MSGYITDAEAWAAKCVDDPRWLAQCLQRIGRFGGQHPTANVLMHSLEVWWMCRHEKPETQLFALLHDAHEVITGDVTRIAKSLELHRAQEHLDSVLLQRLGDIEPDIGIIRIHDATCGDVEHQDMHDVYFAVKTWADVIWLHGIDRAAAVDTFEIKARSLMAVIAATKGTE